MSESPISLILPMSFLENRYIKVIPQTFFCLEQLAQGDEQQQESNLQAYSLYVN